jgi:hypothetical protein
MNPTVQASLSLEPLSWQVAEAVSYYVLSRPVVHLAFLHTCMYEGTAGDVFRFTMARIHRGLGGSHPRTRLP